MLCVVNVLILMLFDILLFYFKLRSLLFLNLLLRQLKNLFLFAFLLQELLLLKFVVFGLAMLVNLVLASKAHATRFALELSNYSLLDWISYVILLLI